MSIPYKPGPPLTCAQIRELDRRAIEEFGIPGIVLMENAARGCAEIMYSRLAAPAADSVVILCGPGNNGGDGFAIARHLDSARVKVFAVLTAARERYAGDAATNLHILEKMGVSIVDGTTPDGLAQAAMRIEPCQLVVDALLGTGARGAPREPMAELIRLANTASPARRIAIDIPSGLDADAGTVAEPCFRADETITFVAEKIGFATPAARAVLGRVTVIDVGIPR